MSTSLTTIYGGRKVPVILNDGTEQLVFVRTLPLRLVPRYLELILSGDDQGVIELCLGHAKDWGATATEHQADAFNTESQEALLAACDELNFFTAQRWIERNKTKREKIAPLLQALYAVQTTLMGPSLTQMATLLASSLTQLSPSASPSTPSSTAPAPSSSSSSSAMPAAPSATPMP
jgi:hypothetical protein